MVQMFFLTTVTQAGQKAGTKAGRKLVIIYKTRGPFAASLAMIEALVVQLTYLKYHGKGYWRSQVNSSFCMAVIAFVG